MTFLSICSYVQWCAMLASFCYVSADIAVAFEQLHSFFLKICLFSASNKLNAIVVTIEEITYYDHLQTRLVARTNDNQEFNSV